MDSEPINPNIAEEFVESDSLNAHKPLNMEALSPEHAFDYKLLANNLADSFVTLLLKKVPIKRQKPQNTFTEVEWLFESREYTIDTIAETMQKKAVYFNISRDLSLYALTRLFKDEYDLIKAMHLRDHAYPATQCTIEIGYEQTTTVWDYGRYCLTNKTNGQRLYVIVSDMNLIVIGIREESEVTNFENKLNEYTIKYDFYKNQTLSFDRNINFKFLPTNAVSKEDIILPAKTWEEIDINILNIFLKNEIYKEKLIPTKRGIILEGPPGNGKSMLVKWIENKLRNKVTFFYVTDGIIDNNASALAEIFKKARYYSPCVLIFEDVDSIGGSRSARNTSVVTTELLSQLDGIEKLEDFVIIATTNYAGRLDSALRNRPNRFDRRIKIELPNTNLRLSLLKKFLALKNQGATMTNEMLMPVAESMNNFSGAQINEVVVTALIFAVHNDRPEVEIPHLMQAVEFIKENYYDDERIQDSKDNIDDEFDNSFDSDEYEEEEDYPEDYPEESLLRQKIYSVPSINVSVE